MAMQLVEIELKGTTPLLCHSAAMVDPENEIKKQIERLTAKKKNKTEEDEREIAKLEWFGGLYLDKNIPGPAMPTANVRRCLIGGARVTRQGKQIERGVLFKDMNVPLIYDGTRNLEELYEDKAFTNRAPVVVGMNRIIRTRPMFPEWLISAEAYVETTIIDMDDFVRITEFTGLVEGLGDNRTNGFGRFIGKVTVK